MTIVLLNAEDIFGRGAGGTVEARPWAGDKAHVVVDGQQVIFANPAEILLRSGAPTRPISLDPTDGRYCIRWVLQSEDRRSRLTRYTSIPGVASVTFGDLVDVDPDTFLPDESTIPAWEAAVADVRLAAGEAAQSAAHASNAADAAAGSELAAASSANRADLAAAEAQLLAARNIVVTPNADPNLVSITVPSHIILNDATAVRLFAS